MTPARPHRFLPPLRAVRLFLCLGIGSPLAASAATTATYFYQQPYYGRSDSPFYQGILNGTIYLEDFEDRQLNTPYVKALGGNISPFKRAAVDEDDGKKDRRTSYAYTWTVITQGETPALLDFGFLPNAEGKLPEYAGGVLLGGNPGDGGLDRYTTILAYDSQGVEITDGKWLVIEPRIPAGASPNTSMADRFAGIYYPGGISRITFLDIPSVDHLQYGYAIPEPTAAAFLALAGAGLLTRRTRHGILPSSSGSFGSGNHGKG